MKRLFKIFFIIFAFFISFCPIAIGASDYVATKNITIIENISTQELHQTLKSSESYVVSNTFLPLEISASSEREETFANGFLDKNCAQNKFLQQIFNAKYNQLFLAKSHNISSYLKNEICTRAP